MPAVHRWRVLAASVVVVLCTGVVYSFSVFAGPLQARHGWTMAQVLTAFTVNGALAPLPMVLGGVLLDRGRARPLMMAGAVLFGAGFVLSGLAGTPLQLCLAYGVLAAFGVGFCYSTAVSNTVRLFPDRQGLAVGLITAGVGGGTVIGAPVARAVIDAVGISAAFVRMGLVYGVVALAAAWFVRSAPLARAGADDVPGVPWRTMLRSPRFPVLFTMLAAAMFAPVMMLSALSGMAQGRWYGLSAAVAALVVAGFSACSAAGGVAWGVLADRRGQAHAVLALFVVALVGLVVMLTVRSPVGLVVGVALLGSCFGGAMGVFPALTMTTFGPRHQGTNYAIMFAAYSLASFVGPRTATLGAGGDWTVPLLVAATVAVAGAALTAGLRRAATRQPAPHRTAEAVVSSS